MAYRGVSMIPLLFSVMMLIQGLFQVGIYTYFHQLAYSPSTPFFSSTYSPLWAGVWNFLAGLSLIFVLSTGGDKQWRQVRSISLLIFLSVLITQATCWILCEVLEFRFWLVIQDPDSADANRRFVWAYISSTAASVIGVTVGTCGFFYIFVIFYRLANILFTDTDRTAVIRNSRRARVSGRKRSKTSAGPGSAPPALRQRSSQTADSWYFVRFRSSTPKAKSDLVRRHRFGGSKKCHPDFGRAWRGRSNFEISEDEFNQSAPLKMIAAIHPNAFQINAFDSDDLQSPSLVECCDTQPKCNNNNCDRSMTGKEMSSFFDEGRVQHLVSAKEDEPRLDGAPTIHGPTPPPPPPVRSSRPHHPKEVRNVAVPATAWRLPSVPKPRVAKALNFSEDCSSGRGGSGSHVLLQVRKDANGNEASSGGPANVVDRL